MKKLFAATLALASSAAIADCTPQMDELVKTFAKAELMVEYACQRKYPMQDIDECLDSQFNQMREVSSVCKDPRGEKAVEAGRIYDRKGELVGLDFRAMRMELLNLGVY